MSAETARTLLALYWVATVAFATYLAWEKGRNPGLWFVLAAIFNVVALIAIAGLPVVDLDAEEAYEARMLEQDRIEREALARAQSSGTTPWDPRAGGPPQASP